ncbi:hypothetical protein V6N11_071823 [Hibiscus sabdariffa]|uniref:Uncharacterized protein n=1 Tax=Hibiscus sabdariffa TaxID=183260 RepID=A0ABR2U195_9ROSI
MPQEWLSDVGSACKFTSTESTTLFKVYLEIQGLTWCGILCQILKLLLTSKEGIELDSGDIFCETDVRLLGIASFQTLGLYLFPFCYYLCVLDFLSPTWNMMNDIAKMVEDLTFTKDENIVLEDGQTEDSNLLDSCPSRPLNSRIDGKLPYGDWMRNLPPRRRQRSVPTSADSAFVKPMLSETSTQMQAVVDVEDSTDGTVTDKLAAVAMESQGWQKHQRRVSVGRRNFLQRQIDWYMQ